MRSSASRWIGAAGCLFLCACGGSEDGGGPTPIPTPTPTPCTYSLSTRAHTFPSGGGSTSVTVTTDATCSWSATTEAPWVTLADAGPRTGSGSVTITAAPLATQEARSAVVIVASQNVTITQQGIACTITLVPDAVSRTFNGGSGRFDVSTAGGCPWRAASTVPWLQVRSPLDEARGPGSVEYGIDENAASTERIGTITVGGATYTVKQSGIQAACAYQLSTVSVNLHHHDNGANITMDTGAGCAWTARSTASWLTIPDGERFEGPRTLRVLVTSYTGEITREAAVEVRWSGPQVGENVWIRQSGCNYAVAPGSVAFGAAGGAGFVTVLAGSTESNCMVGCAWVAEPQVPWIHITSGSPGSGDNPFRFQVDANPGAARTGTVKVERSTLTVTQSGATMR